MMSRSTQKDLIKLLMRLNDMWQRLDLTDIQQRAEVIDILETVGSRCQQEFEPKKAAKYQDILTELSNIIQGTDWSVLNREEEGQCLDLCMDVVMQFMNNLQNEREIKKDIVFLPYKASMWDSLESIWQAAYADKEHCNTYVVPIPYCDLNPDRSIARWHWEIDEFPDYVPVLDWQEYTLEKLEEMKPDAIFIHNPYDECNRVTSVDERYYSRNLKKCTDLLIYIPYFITKWTVDYGKCNVPGIVNADYVIVQDDVICECYKNNYRYPEEKNKFIILGSPKVDKIRNIKRENYPLPQKWKSIIGKKKYVIFFNTTFHGMCEQSNVYVKRLKDLFEAAKKSRDVVLWWRPHPLFENGLEAMFPDVASEYQEVKNLYINSNIGIYDDLPDFYTAFVWSDAYYGDESSLYILYQCMGKPTRSIHYDVDSSQDFCSGCDLLINQIENGVFKQDRLISDVVPKDAGSNIYKWVKSIWGEMK